MTSGFRHVRHDSGATKKTEPFLKAALVASCGIILETLGVHCWHSSENGILGRINSRNLDLLCIVPTLNKSYLIYNVIWIVQCDKSLECSILKEPKNSKLASISHQIRWTVAPSEFRHKICVIGSLACAAGKFARILWSATTDLSASPWMRPFREVEPHPRGSTAPSAASPLGQSSAPWPAEMEASESSL